MNYSYYRLPRFSRNALIIWNRNIRVWVKLIGPALVLHFIEPLIYLFGLGFGLGVFVGDINNIPYLTFLASGLVASSAMMTASLEGTYSVFTRMVPQKTYSAILASPIEIDDIMAGELLWCATKATIGGIAIIIVASLMGAVESWAAVLAIPVVFLSALCFTGPAIVIASMAPGYDYFNYYFTLGVTPMFVLCGVFYPVSTLPETLQFVVQLLPLTHGVELIRPLIAGTEAHNPLLHIFVLAAYAIVFYYLAVIMVRKKIIQ
ncbi:MAG: ABC transporter permease [Gammaproteobacteria bacterium]|nr:ABC transporter permease [Gammaproteobacteria bacterium]